MRLSRLAVLAAALLAAAPALAQKKAAGILPGGSSRAPVKIDAAKLDYFDKEQKLVYTGNVVARQGESTLKAAVLTAFLTSSETKSASGEAAAQPASTSPMSSGGNQIRRIEGVGPITVTQQESVGLGDRLVYEKSEDKLYLIGNVSLSQGANLIKGCRLIYDLTVSTAHVEPCPGQFVNSTFIPGSDDSAAGGKKKPAKAAPAAKPKTP